MRIEDLYKKESELDGVVQNAIAGKIEISFIAHFNNSPEVRVIMQEPSNPYCFKFPALGEGQMALGYIIDGILKVLDLSQSDGVKLHELTNFPLRVILSGDGGIGESIIGFGHLIKDRFILIKDLNMFAFKHVKEVLNR